MAYHLRHIEKGTLGEWSKVEEELEEFLEALEQNASIMAVLELSDMYGALNLFCLEHYKLTFESIFKNEYKSYSFSSISPTTSETIRDAIRDMNIYLVLGIKQQLEHLATIHVLLDRYVDKCYMLDVEDLKIMATITARAFKSGHRT